MTASSSRPTLPGFLRWLPHLGFAALLLAATLALREDFARRSAVAIISEQGSPRPPADVHSPTGYAHGQRYFLGAQERGDTFRWIAAAQEMLVNGPLAGTSYRSDNTPDGRPALAPRLYTAWLASLAWIDHTLTGQSAGAAVENVALWEPILAHLVALAVATAFLTRRFGWKAGVAGGIFLCLFPALGAQYLPGVLSPRPWAMLLAWWALVLAFFWTDTGESAATGGRGSVASGIVAGVALWLDPAIGFPVVLVTAGAGLILAFLRPGAVPWLRWALAGAATVGLAWLIDRSPHALAAGELRYVHPFYALAWLGLGLLLQGVQAWRAATGRRRTAVLTFLAGVAVVTTAAVVQIRSGFPGWFYPGVALLHPSSLDETLPPFANVLAGLRAAPRADWFFTLAPALAGALLLATTAWSARRTTGFPRLVFLLATLLGLIVLACFRVRWWFAVSALALPLAALLLPTLPATWRRLTVGAIACYFAALVLWRAPTLLAPARPPVEPAASDVEAMVFRHFTYWLVGHTASGSVAALATPALSDALVHHGSCRVLVSTAWESHLGLVATSRILSAPDWNEVEGILQRRQLTHIVINSWDQVLAQFVRAPEAHRNETFHAQLQRWVFPRYLRPVPYRLPAGSGFDGQVIAVLQMTAPHDEGLALSRLAEYFVEMDRDYLAKAAARILGEAHADDPNALIARALVLHHTRDRAGFEGELAQLVARSARGNLRLDWDRRVQRAIVFALGGRHDLARPEIAACTAAAEEKDLRELSPLQAFRYLKLADNYGVQFRDPALRRIAESLCVEYAPKKSP